VVGVDLVLLVASVVCLVMLLVFSVENRFFLVGIRLVVVIFVW